MNVAIIVSGGVGKRFGGEIPKQYTKIDGKPVISYVMDTLLSCNRIDLLVVAARPQWYEMLESLVPQSKLLLTEAGNSRQETIWNGLKAAEKYSDVEYVLVQDAVRPVTSLELIERCFDSIAGYDGVMPVLPMKDTIYEIDESQTVSGFLDRSRIFAGQAPELFDYKKYYEVNKAQSKKGFENIYGSSEVAGKNGMKIRTIPGEERNIKLTTTKDSELIERYLKDKKKTTEKYESIRSERNK